MNTIKTSITIGSSVVSTLLVETLRDTNKKLSAGFVAHYKDAGVKRSHLFDGRHENIYLNESHIPELKLFVTEACREAERILSQAGVSAGYWFNYMPPGATTTAHSHDDDDELLSAVYYIAAPENSGNLLIHSNGRTMTITPKEGMFIFFKPDMMHEVTENLSEQARLSIGINFGISDHGKE